MLPFACRVDIAEKRVLNPLDPPKAFDGSSMQVTRHFKAPNDKFVYSLSMRILRKLELPHGVQLDRWKEIYSLLCNIIQTK